MSEHISLSRQAHLHGDTMVAPIQLCASSHKSANRPSPAHDSRAHAHTPTWTRTRTDGYRPARGSGRATQMTQRDPAGTIRVYHAPRPAACLTRSSDPLARRDAQLARIVLFQRKAV